jgi:hypothetical protein
MSIVCLASITVSDRRQLHWPVLKGLHCLFFTVTVSLYLIYLRMMYQMVDGGYCHDIVAKDAISATEGVIVGYNQTFVFITIGN